MSNIGKSGIPAFHAGSINENPRLKSGYINRKYGEELGKGEISTEGFTRGDFREFESLRSGGGT
jgi:hypothetical protein